MNNIFLQHIIIKRLILKLLVNVKINLRLINAVEVLFIDVN